MTFKKNLEDYFIIGEKYMIIGYCESILECTGIIKYNDCPGFFCGIHGKFGQCDGQYKPTFKGYSDGLCAYAIDGYDRFIRIQNTNERW